MSVVSQWRYNGGPVLTLDAKGRLTVPAMWRDQIFEQTGGKLILTKDPSNCLALFPPSVYAQLAAVLEALPEKDAGWKRLYTGSFSPVEIDSASRILIPPELRRWAGLAENGSVIFMGIGTHFELWDPRRSEAQESQLLSGDKPEALSTMVLK